MDWTKAKTIIIFALLVTNIFLIFTYGFDKTNKDENREEVLISVLENNNIFLSCDIPKTPGKLPVLYIEYSDIDQKKLQAIINEKKFHAEALTFLDNDLIDTADLFIKENNLENKNMIFDKVIEIDGVKIVSYINKIENIKVEESYIKCYFKEGELTSVEAYWLEAKAFSDGKKNIIPASQALITFMSQLAENQAEIVIEGIELVYWLDADSVIGEGYISDTALPSWKITYNDNQKMHIYAHEQ